MTSPEMDPSIYKPNHPHQIQTECDMQSQEYPYKAKHEAIATRIGELSAPTCVEENQQQRQIQANDQQAQHQTPSPQSQQAVEPPSQEAQKTKLTRPVADKLQLNRKRKRRFSRTECIPQQPLKQQQITWLFEEADLQLKEVATQRCLSEWLQTSWCFELGSKSLEDMFASSQDRINYPRLYCNNLSNGDTAISLQSAHFPPRIQQGNQTCSPNGPNQPAAGLSSQCPRAGSAQLSVPHTTVSSQGSNIHPMQRTGAVSWWKQLRKFVGLGQKF